jgi:quercetin dioxygenase-like cupin family protein
MMKLKQLLVVMCLLPVYGWAAEHLGTREVLLDNDRVQLVRLTYAAGAESGVHTHAYAMRSVYVERGGKLQVTAADGSVKVMALSRGQALYLPAATHNVKNIGRTKIIMIEQELK